MVTQDEATRAIGHLITEWVIELRDAVDSSGPVEIDDGHVAELAGHITDYFRREGGITLGDETGG